jgi:hypothetical protein
MTTTTDTVRYYHVVAGRSEGINVATIDEARELAATFAEMTVRVWAVTGDGEMSLVVVADDDYAVEVIA